MKGYQCRVDFPKSKALYAVERRGLFGMGSLAVTYFRTRMCTIIGATSFHGPVRDGKGWVQSAMAAKRNLYAPCDIAGCAKWEEGFGESLFGCDCMNHDELLLKVIGSSLTGN